MMKKEVDVDNHDTEENGEVDVELMLMLLMTMRMLTLLAGLAPLSESVQKGRGRAHDYSDSRFIDTSLIRPKKRLLEPNKQDNI